MQLQSSHFNAITPETAPRYCMGKWRERDKKCWRKRDKGENGAMRRGRRSGRVGGTEEGLRGGKRGVKGLQHCWRPDILLRPVSAAKKNKKTVANQRGHFTCIPTHTGCKKYLNTHTHSGTHRHATISLNTPLQLTGNNSIKPDPTTAEIDSHILHRTQVSTLRPLCLLSKHLVLF